MTVRKLRAKQRGPACSYCHFERAVWRGSLFERFACDAHWHMLVEWDDEVTARDNAQEWDGF